MLGAEHRHGIPSLAFLPFSILSQRSPYSSNTSYPRRRCRSNGSPHSIARRGEPRHSRIFALAELSSKRGIGNQGGAGVEGQKGIGMVDYFQAMVFALHYHASRVIIEAFDVDLHFGSALPSHVLVPARPRIAIAPRTNTPGERRVGEQGTAHATGVGCHRNWQAFLPDSFGSARLFFLSPRCIQDGTRPRNIFGDLRCNTPDAWL